MKEFFGPLGIIAILVFAATMVNPRVGLFLIIFSIILSPEFRVFDRPIRIEDVLLMVVILAWIAIMATQGRKFADTPINGPILLYLFISFLALVNALVFGNISPFTGNPQDISVSILTFLKKIEYFLVFFVVSNTVHTFRHVRQYVALMLVACALSAAYALNQGPGMTPAEEIRVAAPFDPEPNTYGQYLMFNIVLILSLVFCVRSLFQKLLLFGLLAYTTTAFMLTFSRGSYVALLVSVLLLGIIRERRIILGTVFCIIFSSLLFSQSVISRVQSGFNEVQEWYQGNADPGGNSFLTRVNSFQEGFSVASKNPVLGVGIGNIPLNRIEAQLPKEALETGFLGLFAFLWVMFSIAKICWKTIQSSKNEYVKGLSYGMLFALVAYFVSGFSAVPFTTIRTAEPFWFLCGLVAVCHILIQQGHELPEIEPFEKTRGKSFRILSSPAVPVEGRA